MIALNRRLRRLEEQLRPIVAERQITVQCGNLRRLPADYSGQRHVVTTKHPPADSTGRIWFEWEERPGPEPKSDADGPDDPHVIRVCFVEAKDGKPAY